MVSGTILFSTGRLHSEFHARGHPVPSNNPRQRRAADRNPGTLRYGVRVAWSGLRAQI